MKICSKCNIEKTLDEFYNCSACPKFKKTNRCKTCITKYRIANKEKTMLYMRNLRVINNETVKRNRRRSYRNLDPLKRLVQTSASRARRNNLEHNITVDDLILPDKCPLLGIPFKQGIKNNYAETYSLDRINPALGYVKRNVWIISMRANTMKSNASKEELNTFAKNILKYFKDDDIVRTTLKNVEVKDKEPLR